MLECGRVCDKGTCAGRDLGWRAHLPPKHKTTDPIAFWGKPAAPGVQIIPARAMGYTQCYRAKAPGRCGGVLSHVHTHTRTQKQAFGHAHICLHPCACTCMHSYAQTCPQMPPRPSPASWLLPALLSTPRQGSPARALPVAMAMLHPPGDEVCSPTPPWRGAESSWGGPSCPCHPRFCPPACTLQCCPRDVPSLVAPTQPRHWTLGPGLQLPHKAQTCCLQDQGTCQGVSFGGTTSPHHGEPPSANHTTQEEALHSGRQDRDNLHPTVTPHPHTDPGLRHDARSTHMSRAHPGPCHTMAPSRAGGGLA